jgi:acyl-coenzyme A thioesterase PaaI-like protein
MTAPPPSLFVRNGERFVPTLLARGPWSASALHGGPPAALLARAIERFEGGETMLVTRITLELLRPIPLEPLAVHVKMTRPGRKVQLVEASLHTEAHEVARATGLRIRRTAVRLPPDLPMDPVTVPPPEEGSDATRLGEFLDGFHTHGVEHRFVRGQLATPGPATDWIRLRVPLLEGEEPSPLIRVCAAADFGNGASQILPSSHTYINPDLTIYLHRYPRGEWVCIDAVTRVEDNGIGLAESRLLDRDGTIGRAVQSLIIEERK